MIGNRSHCRNSGQPDGPPNIPDMVDLPGPAPGPGDVLVQAF